MWLRLFRGAFFRVKDKTEPVDISEHSTKEKSIEICLTCTCLNYTRRRVFVIPINRWNYLRSRSPPSPPTRVSSFRHEGTRHRPPCYSRRRGSSSPLNSALCGDSGGSGRDAGKRAPWKDVSHS